MTWYRVGTGDNFSTGKTKSESSQTSQSTSGPVATPQSELSLLLSKAAEQTGQNVYQWAQSTLAPDQYMTDQAIGHYMSAANTQEGLANLTAGQYNRITSPELVAQANQAATYNSAARQQVEAGHAEAQALQGSYAGIQNAEQQLQAYGIRPDSGVYQELNRATQAGAGAAAAASGTQAAQHVADTGRQMLGQAIATGQQLPGQSVNSANAANQAVSGAQNAQLANTTTGAQALGASQPFLQTASNLTPESNASQSTSSGTSTETGETTAHSQTFQPVLPTGMVGDPPVAGMAQGGAIPVQHMAIGGGLKVMHMKMPHVESSGGKGATEPLAAKIHIGKKHGGGGGPGKGDVTSDNADKKALQEMGYLGPDGGGGRHHYGPVSSTANEAADDGGGGGGHGGHGGGHGKRSGGSSSSNSSDSSPSSSGPASIGSGGLPPNAGPSADPSATPSAIPSPSPGAPLDISPPAQAMGAGGGGGGGGGGGDFAAGGAIPSPTTGGHVNRNLSPSHGAKTDDIPAQLNADEFVMPRDVAKYYGQKTFQDMILKARKAMGNHDQTPAAPTLKPATGQAPRFVSQHMADGGMPLAGIPSPGQATGDTASMNDPARSQYTTQFNHQDAGSQWQ